jgi:hypothetical protein
MINFEADTGPRLQTCHASLSTIILELQSQDLASAETDYPTIEDPESTDVLRLMAQYPDITASTFKSLEPHTILSYLLRLSDALADLLQPQAGDEDDVKGTSETGETGGPDATTETPSKCKARCISTKVRDRYRMACRMRLLSAGVSYRATLRQQGNRSFCRLKRRNKNVFTIGERVICFLVGSIGEISVWV